MIFSDQLFTKANNTDFSKNAPLQKKMVHFNCVLLVDDDSATNFLNRRLFKKNGLAETIQIARNGVEAMEYLTRAHQGDEACPVPDLVLLDINMPLVNGWEFLERYESLPEDFKKSISIFMLTTSLREDDVEQSKKWQVVKGFIQKPLTQQAVFESLEKNFK